jgi:hypothetical protein
MGASDDFDEALSISLTDALQLERTRTTNLLKCRLGLIFAFRTKQTRSFCRRGRYVRYQLLDGSCRLPVEPVIPSSASKVKVIASVRLGPNGWFEAVQASVNSRFPASVSPPFPLPLFQSRFGAPSPICLPSMLQFFPLSPNLTAQRAFDQLP